MDAFLQRNVRDVEPIIGGIGSSSVRLAPKIPPLVANASRLSFARGTIHLLSIR